MKAFHWFLLVFLSMLWGTSFLFTKLALESFSPFSFAFLRIGLAALLAAWWLKSRGVWAILGERWRVYLPMAVFHSALPFSFFAWGQQYIDSGLAGVMNSVTPLFTLLLVWLVKLESPQTLKSIGIIIGLGGVIVLLQPSPHDGEQELLGTLACLVAACSYGVAAVYTRLRLGQYSSMENTCGQLILSALVLTPFMLWEAPWKIETVSLSSWGALFASAFFSTFVAFLIYFRLVSGAGALNTTLVAYLIPIVAVIWGATLLDEQLGYEIFVGGGLILTGLFIAGKRPTNSK